MVTTVELQNPFEYSLWVSIFAAALIVLAVAIVAFILIRLLLGANKKASPVPAVVQAPMTRRMIQSSKDQYIQRVQDIKNRYASGAVSKRVGYQELRAVVREFVHCLFSFR